MRKKIIITATAVLLLAAAVLGVLFFVMRDRDFSLEDKFIELQTEGKILNYYVSDESDIEAEKALITGFDGTIVYSISGFLDDKTVTVHQMQDADEAKAAYELILPLLNEGCTAKRDGKYLIYGHEELVKTVKL